MKPVPSSLLIVLLLALCGLCAWQWHRESELRLIVKAQLMALEQVTAQRDELETHVKAADAEILRLTGALAELRANSVAKQLLEDAQAAHLAQRQTIDNQNTTLQEQNTRLLQANEAITRVNANLRQLTAQRDQLAQRLNDLTAQYNALAKKGSDR